MPEVSLPTNGAGCIRALHCACRLGAWWRPSPNRWILEIQHALAKKEHFMTPDAGCRRFPPTTKWRGPAPGAALSLLAVQLGAHALVEKDR